jgi:hypothetical protein
MKYAKETLKNGGRLVMVTPIIPTPEEFTKPLEFVSLRHATVTEIKTEPYFLPNGASCKRGNYTLNYTTASKKPVTFAGRRHCSLQLEIHDASHRFDVSSVKSGHPIGEGNLWSFLNHVNNLNLWAVDAVREVDCRLVVNYNGKEIVSNTCSVRTPVRPWTGALDPDRFAEDNSIKYCRSEGGRYAGRSLTKVGMHNCFTFLHTLETDPSMRGFCCIGFVGAVFGIAPG